jgi:hypothetical protein
MHILLGWVASSDGHPLQTPFLGSVLQHINSIDIEAPFHERIFGAHSRLPENNVKKTKPFLVFFRKRP